MESGTGNLYKILWVIVSFMKIRRGRPYVCYGRISNSIYSCTVTPCVILTAKGTFTMSVQYSYIFGSLLLGLYRKRVSYAPTACVTVWLHAALFMAVIRIVFGTRWVQVPTKSNWSKSFVRRSNVRKKERNKQRKKKKQTNKQYSTGFEFTYLHLAWVRKQTEDFGAVQCILMLGTRLCAHLSSTAFELISP